MDSILFGDFETRSLVNLKSSGADVYARHPSTEVMAFGFAFDDGPVKVTRLGDLPPISVCEHVHKGGKFVAHNAPFEWLIWNYVWRRDHPSIPELKISQLICTQVMSYSMGLPGSLEKAAPAAGITQEKDLKGQRVMVQLCQPKEVLGDQVVVWWDHAENQDKYERLYAYCAQDIEVERELYKRLLPLSVSERALWELDHAINQRGVRVDVPSAAHAIDIVALEQDRLNKEIRDVTGNAVATCTATTQLKDWLNSLGIETDGVAKSDVTELLSREDLPPKCRRALELRREAAKSSTAKFDALIDRTSVDGRMRSTLQFYGAGTGRWAGRGFQLHNLPRPKLSESEIEGVFDVLGE